MAFAFSSYRNTLAALGAASMTVASVNAAELVTRDKSVAGRYIVVLKHDASTARADHGAQLKRRHTTANELTGRHGGRTAHVYQRAVHGFVATMSDRQARAMLKDSRVRFIEQDSRVQIAQTVQTNATWGLDRIDQRDAPVNGTYAYNTTGAGVTAYVIDTGILSSHTEFGGRVAKGFSGIQGDTSTEDCNGHGTHVAGTIGSKTYGVAKDVTLVPVRVLECNGGGFVSSIIAGVDWVAAHRKLPAVANMSTSGTPSDALDDAINNAIAAGVTFVVAAGNSNANACDASPARVSAALTVGASVNDDTRAYFSNYGACVDLFAPGMSITSTWIGGNTATYTANGTSMASPHVAGTAALLLQRSPGATRRWSRTRSSTTRRRTSSVRRSVKAPPTAFSTPSAVTFRRATRFRSRVSPIRARAAIAASTPRVRPTISRSPRTRGHSVTARPRRG